MFKNDFYQDVNKEWLKNTDIPLNESRWGTFNILEEDNLQKIKLLLEDNINCPNEDFRKLDSEQLFIRKKMDEVVKEMQQLENNLGFFANAKDDNPLVLNVKNSVNELKEDLKIWKEKLSYLRKLDY